MKVEDYQSRISLFYQANPHLSHEDLAVVLTADLMYKNLPDDLVEFRKRYAHFDPSVLQRRHQGITFLRIAGAVVSPRAARELLNAYLNIKFHDISNRKGFEHNALLFHERSRIATAVLEEILLRADFPEEITAVLREKEEVRNCLDSYEMLRMFKETDQKRLQYEILRKLGMIVLIASIERTVEIQDLERKKREIWRAFDRGLRRGKRGTREYYLWLNAKRKVEYSTDPAQARSAYDRDLETRRRQAYKIYPLQRFVCHPFTTPAGNQVLHMEIRNKFRRQGALCYASYVEKMIRKNLEFPNEVHDTIGVKIVVERERQIPGIIRDLESFLGGSSTRKMEKNTYHGFGRRRLSEYSSPEYFVWKANYDIALPHSAISHLRKILKLTRGNPDARREIRRRLEYYIDYPTDFVIEVQLQDIKSYLLSIAKGSSTAHTWLKMNQIRSNSFYKFFPREIYERDVTRLKFRLLDQGEKG